MLETDIKIDIRNCLKKMKKIRDKSFISNEIKNLAKDALRRIRMRTPGKGTIRNLWNIEYETVNGLVKSATIFNRYKEPDVIGYLEYGTKPHSINPKVAQALHFFSGSFEIFAKSVMHPGTPEYAMVSKTKQEILLKLNAFCNKVAKSIVNRSKQG